MHMFLWSAFGHVGKHCRSWLRDNRDYISISFMSSNIINDRQLRVYIYLLHSSCLKGLFSLLIFCLTTSIDFLCGRWGCRCWVDGYNRGQIVRMNKICYRMTTFRSCYGMLRYHNSMTLHHLDWWVRKHDRKKIEFHSK